MKNEYLVIRPGGQVMNAAAYHKEGLGSPDFRVFIEREALGQSVIRGSEGKPDYLAQASHLGFGWEPNADIGIARYDYKANLMHRLVQAYARALVRRVGMPLYEVSGSNLFSLNHPVVQAYAKLYGDRLYQFRSGSSDLVMSYDASYPQFNLAARHPLKEQNLPFAHFSISDCYRHEQSGECMLLYRQRRFFMPDVHPYFKDVEQAFAWYPRFEEQIVRAAGAAGRQFEMVIEVAGAKVWDRYRSDIVPLANHFGRDVLVNIQSADADRYWIINVDYKILDALGQAREIACIQIDVGNAARLGIQYEDAWGYKHHPVIIHSAIPGGIERYLYMALDGLRGPLPMWMSPVQVRLIPVADRFIPLCEQLADGLPQPVRLEIDDRSMSVAKKIKLARQDLIPVRIVVGEKEQQAARPKALDDAIAAVQSADPDLPFLPLDWPRLLSQQLQ